MPRAVVLLSGGLDSATTLAIARSEGRTCHCLSVGYGQRHAIELEAARAVSASLGAAEHRCMELDLAAFGGSALTDPSMPVPRKRAAGQAPRAGETGASEIPPTYVPARNTIFLALALAWAEVLEAEEIFIGAHAVDYAGYPDCRPEYMDAFQRLAGLATRAGVEGRAVRIRAPLLDLSKADIIRRGAALGVDFALTHSCYDPDDQGRACGACDSCVLRRKGFREAGVPDPTQYQAGTR